VISNIKSLGDVKVGDTIRTTEGASARAAARLQATPSRWSSAASTRPMPATSRTCARPSRSCSLNDSSFTFEPETSDALGFGFRCGFLGLLHMEIVQERLEREDDMDLVQTAPNVSTRSRCPRRRDARDPQPRRPARPGEIDALSRADRQPLIIVPTDHIGAVMKLVIERRGKYENTEYLVGESRQMLTFDLPLSEIIFDFHDR
jgi:GTP-binding protein LepA